MKTKILKILMYIFGIVALLHWIAYWFIASMAISFKENLIEDVIKVAEYRIYPPFIGASLDCLHEAEFMYKQQPDSWTKKMDLESAKYDVVDAVVFNMLIMCILSTVMFGIFQIIYLLKIEKIENTPMIIMSPRRRIYPHKRR